jgi:hypothetical protein
MRLYKLTVVIILLVSLSGLAQPTQFNYQRKIDGIINEGWYTFSMPASIFNKINRDFSDLRIYNISKTDTIEVPYLLKIRTDDVTEDVVQVPVLNKSKKDGALFMTFKFQKGQHVNYLDLNFEENNFFAFVTLEGSNDQREWFSITDKQRILSIDNAAARYKVSSVNFPQSDYTYLRASIKSDLPLKFISASFRDQKISRGNYSTIPASLKIHEDKNLKQTVVDLKLRDYVPVSKVLININPVNDYYRQFKIEYVSDSVQTPKGWIRNYQSFYEGYLTSFNPNTFDFTYDLAKQIRITINNLDNPPLAINSVEITGPVIDVITKASAGEIYLCYGNSKVTHPSYDLDYFQEKIPPTLSVTTLGDERSLLKPLEKTSAIFENKLWLWGIMGLIIGTLGFFTLRMMKK